MRVLHLTTEFPPVIYGGLGTAVGGWVHASARSGLDVGVLLVEGVLVLEGSYWGSTRAFQASREPVTDAERVLFFQATWADAVQKGLDVVERWQPDVVHLHTAMLWPVADEIQRRSGQPLVYHVHSVDRAEYELGEEPNQRLAHSEAQEQALAAADRLIALSEDEARLLQDYYPEASGRIRVVGNGIDDTLAARSACTRRRPTSKRLLVLYSGRLVERKGIRELLAAIPLVLSDAPETQFVIAGGPPPLTGKEVAGQWLTPALEESRDRVEFTGWLSPAAVAARYTAADVLVCPSRYEPFGMVFLEGMLHGLAVVASETGGSREILAHERTALLVPPRDVEALAASILRLLRDGELRGALGRAAAAEVRARWLWPARIGRMRRVYSELVAARR